MGLQMGESDLEPFPRPPGVSVRDDVSFQAGLLSASFPILHLSSSSSSIIANHCERLLYKDVELPCSAAPRPAFPDKSLTTIFRGPCN